MKTVYLIFIFVIAGCTPNAENAKYRIPYGFKGQVFIFFNIEDGAKREYKDGFRIYNIPPNGVLKTQFNPNYGYLSIGNSKYVYVDSPNREYPLKVESQDYRSKDPNEIYISGGETGGIGDKITYQTFIVKSNKDSFVYINRYMDAMDSVLNNAGLK